jgi:hypothetical protein
MQCIVVTQDYAGHGFAVRLQEKGHGVLLATNPEEKEMADPEVCRRYRRVGDGMVEKVSLRDVMQKRSSFKDAYWIWDLNHSVEENDTLRQEGFRVHGGNGHAYTMEHHRKGCLQFVARHGLKAPPSFGFEGPAEAMSFCAEPPALPMYRNRMRA